MGRLTAYPFGSAYRTRRSALYRVLLTIQLCNVAPDIGGVPTLLKGSYRAFHPNGRDTELRHRTVERA